MITEEIEAARYNNGKAKFLFIDFIMFENMYKYLHYTSELRNATDCIKKMISILSTLSRTDEYEVYDAYIPMLQAVGYRMSMIQLELHVYNSPIYDLRAFESMADVLEHGADKYERNNWRKGYSDRFSTADSLYRHLRQIIIGESIDEESKLPHIGHIMCNIMFLTNDLLYINRED